jgi:glycosyltransferase involved in cell wall biosynthesis
LWDLTSAVVAVSEDTAEALLALNQLSCEKVRTIANGVPVPEVRAEDRAGVRSELGIPAEARTLGIVARLAPEKEHRTLLTAFARVRAAHPDTCLLIVGDGPLRGALERQAAELEIAPAVRFSGFRADVNRMLAAMDVFVLCSSFEGTSLTLLEAMGARLPIVATAVGGTPDALGGSENGYLVPAQDAEALAGALIAALSQPGIARAKAERAYARMTAQYGIQTMTRQYEDLYEQILQPHAAVRDRVLDARAGDAPAR